MILKNEGGMRPLFSFLRFIISSGYKSEVSFLGLWRPRSVISKSKHFNIRLYFLLEKEPITDLRSTHALESLKIFF